MLFHQDDLRKVVRSLSPYRVIACYALFFVVRVDCDTNRDIADVITRTDGILLRSVFEEKALAHELCNVVNCESDASEDKTQQHHPKGDFPIPSIEKGDVSVEDVESQELHGSSRSDNSIRHQDVPVTEPYDNIFTSIPVFSMTSSNIHNGSCRKHSRIFLHQLKRYRMWALQMFDASAKLPSGILRGNVNLFGDYDECMSVDSGILLSEEGERVRGKYCLATVDVQVNPDIFTDNESLNGAVDMSQSYGLIRSTLEDTGAHFIPRFTTMNWGFCVPATCREEDVSNGVEAALQKFNGTSGLQFAVQLEKGMCYEQKEEKSLTAEAQAVLSVFALLFVVTVVATVRDKVTKSPVCNAGKLERVVMAFSLRKNVALLLEDVPADGDINCIHGIRALGTIALYVAHKVIALALIPYSNRVELTKVSNDPLSSLLRASIVYTDTFLMISGVLTAYHLTREVARKGSISWLNKVVTRYIRLTPALVALVVFYAYVFEHLGDGPQWGRVVQQNADICKRNLWRNLLYIQNLGPFQEMCATHTHQLALDFQLSVIAPPIVYLLYKHPVASGLILLLFNIVSVGLRYIVAVNNELSLVIYHGIPMAQLYKTANMMYCWALHRATPYLIGIALGYVLRKTGKNVYIPKAVVVAGWVLSAYFGYYSLLSRFPEANAQFTYNAHDAGLYGAWCPVACSLAVAWLIFACFTGYGGPVNSFLSSRPLTLFSRISYAVYLTQFAVFFYNVGSIRFSEQFTLFRAVNLPEMATVIIISILATLVFDLPMQEIKGILIPSGSSSRRFNAKKEKL